MMVVEIVATALGVSLLVPIGMAFLRPSSARRAALVAWAILLPTLAISCGILASQGESGFLSNSQAVSMGSLFLTLSFGFGYGASKVFHAKSPVKPGL
jgi:hypothetical protein